MNARGAEPRAGGWIVIGPRTTRVESPWRVAILVTGQTLLLAIGLGLLPSWLLSSERPLVMLGTTLTVMLCAQCLLLAGALRRFREATRRMQAKTETAAACVRDDLLRTQQAVVFGLAHLSESRDPHTGQHLKRIKLFTQELAAALHELPQYQSVVTPEWVRLIEVSAMLHDIGKVGIADSILLKPGELTPGERREMELHPLISSDCLERIGQSLGASNFLQMAHEIALYHHERWDGFGYPFGLRGEAIPLSARVVAIADVYDALSSPRVYKPAYPHDKCVEMIRGGSGTQFDPELVEVFLRIEIRIAEISRSLLAADAADAARSTVATAPVAISNKLDNLDELLSSLGVEPSAQKAMAEELVSAR